MGDLDLPLGHAFPSASAWVARPPFGELCRSRTSRTGSGRGCRSNISTQQNSSSSSSTSTSNSNNNINNNNNDKNRKNNKDTAEKQARN
mmetsp:Transcript_21593/g.46979  ORF Transcript_21593/g.46979 Transcript_21593/m.46979 type:complete len:89 (-) Transcript_21593:70-336(-)